MATSRNWRPSHVLSGPFAARLEDIDELNQVFSEAFTERYRRDGMAGVRRVYPSRGNFLLVRFDRAEAAYRNLLDAGIVLRDMRAFAQLGDALRISIGMPEQNRGVVAALRSLAEAA